MRVSRIKDKMMEPGVVLNFGCVSGIQDKISESGVVLIFGRVSRIKDKIREPGVVLIFGRVSMIKVTRLVNLVWFWSLGVFLWLRSQD